MHNFSVYLLQCEGEFLWNLPTQQFSVSSSVYFKWIYEKYIYMHVCVCLCVCLSPFLQSLSQLSHHCQSLLLFFLCTDEKQTVHVIGQFLKLCSKPAVAETWGGARLAWAADAQSVFTVQCHTHLAISPLIEILFCLFYLFGLHHEPPLIATLVVLVPAVVHVRCFCSICAQTIHTHALNLEQSDTANDYKDWENWVH